MGYADYRSEYGPSTTDKSPSALSADNQWGLPVLRRPLWRRWVHAYQRRNARLTDHMLGAGIIAGWNTNKTTAYKTNLGIP